MFLLAVLFVFAILYSLFADKDPVRKARYTAKTRLWGPLKNRFVPILNGPVRQRMYNLLSIAHNVLTKNGVPYAMTANLLLSAVEKGKLRRGVTQATFLVPAVNVRKMLDASDEFKMHGLAFDDLPQGAYRLSSKLPNVIDVSIIILPVILAGNKWITSAKQYDEWYGADELFPAKLYRIGNIDLYGPKNAVNYLHRNYWSVGLHAGNGTNGNNKRWYQLPSKLYTTNQIPVVTRVDYINGIDLDPRTPPYYYSRTIPDRTPVVLGSGRPAMIPIVGTPRPIRKVAPWRRFLWT